MNRLFMAVILLFAGAGLFAQVTFSGKVMDRDGNPLIGANVLIQHTYIGTITDSEGGFLCRGIPAGEHEVLISYIGFETQRITLDLAQDLNRDIVMDRAAYLVDEVIVKGVRAGKLDPVTSQTLTKEELEGRNFGQDIPLLLKHSPSLVSSSDAGNGVGYSGFRIRGTDANRINITVDGIPLNDAESHGVWWVNMPDFASSVENVQIQRGVGTSTNGAAAFGASVNFQTHSLRDKSYAELQSNYGSFNTRKNSLSLGSGMINDHFSFDLRLSELHSDGYIDRAETRLQSLFLTTAYHTDKSILKLNVIMGKEKTYQAWDGVPGTVLGENRQYNGIGWMFTDENGIDHYYENETDNYLQDHYHLHFSHEISSDLYFNSTLHYTRGRGYYEQYKNDQKYSDYQMSELVIGDTLIKRTDLIRQKWLDNHFYGAVFSFNLRKSLYELSFGGGANQYEGDHYGEIIWARFANESELGDRWYEGTGDKNDYNLYGKLNYSILNNLHFYTDLQVRRINYKIGGIDDDLRDLTQEHDFLFFNPKAGLNFRPDNNQRLYLSFSIANREPNRGNFVDADPGQPLPVHETLFDYEFGYSLNHHWLNTMLSLYYMDYKDQLVLTGEINDVGNPVMTNVDNSYRLGAEFSAAVKINRFLNWQGNLSVSRNRILNMISYVDNWDYWSDPENQDYQFIEDGEDKDIAFSPAVVASSVFDVELLKGLELSLQSKYVGKQYLDNTQSEERMLDPWFVNDLIINYDLPVKKLSEFKLNFILANFTNYEYESNAWVYRYYSEGVEQLMDGYYPQAGIHFMAGVKIGF